MDGAATVPTASSALAQKVAAQAVRTAKAAEFFSEPGTGETHALRHFAGHSDVECLYITASPSPPIFEEILVAQLRDSMV